MATRQKLRTRGTSKLSKKDQQRTVRVNPAALALQRL
jgi:hypothetical protein